jgi:hypothetical protein
VKGRTIVFSPEAAKEFDALDATVRARVEAALDRVGLDPWRSGIRSSG